MSESIFVSQLISSMLAELGITNPALIMQSLLISNGFFVGYKLQFPGAYAIWAVEKKTVEIYNDEGKLLKTVAINTPNTSAA